MRFRLSFPHNAQKIADDISTDALKNEREKA